MSSYFRRSYYFCAHTNISKPAWEQQNCSLMTNWMNFKCGPFKTWLKISSTFFWSYCQWFVEMRSSTGDLEFLCWNQAWPSLFVGLGKLLLLLMEQSKYWSYEKFTSSWHQGVCLKRHTAMMCCYWPLSCFGHWRSVLLQGRFSSCPY